MPGFKHDPLADVEAIRQLLSGYETGFPFLKEVVQNANDADASRVWMQWHQGLGDQATHPLLKGPALIIVNDGPFDKESRDGIQFIGLSNRAADTERIGRFGLGVKSLFHVCEGFFFLESEGKEALRGFLTPWHGETLEETEYHKDWWQFGAEEWRTVNDSVKAILPPDFQKWFAIWIPLRRAGHLGEVKPLRNDHPGDEQSCPRKLMDAFLHQAPSIAESMIFLQKVDSVTFHDGESFHLMKHDRPMNEASSGQIQGCRYYKKVLSGNDADVVAEFQCKPNWPTVTDRRTTEQVPDKAKWEGGVAVSLTPADASSGRLRLFWSVFLPVGNHPAINVDLPGCTQNLHLFIHGFFFPNRDRTAVLGADNSFNGAGDDNEDSLKIDWNKELATSPSGVLQLLLPTVLHAFVTEDFSDAKICKVVSGLQASEWFKLYRQPICQKHCVVYCLVAKKWAWLLVESKQTPLVFPKFSEQVTDTETVVVSLLGDGPLDRVVLIEGCATLTARDLRVEWTKDDLEWFCRLVSQEALNEKPEARKYVAKLLSRLGGIATSNPEVWHELPIYEVASIDGKSSVVSAKSLQARASANNLFSNGEAGLKKSFRDACPTASAWFVVGSTPPGISAQAFDTSAVAALVLSQESLGGAKNRTDLIGKLLAAVANPKVKSAIRYLIHGNADNRDADGSLLLRLSANDGASQWNTVIETTLKKRTEVWRLVDSVFSASINDQQKETLNLKMCGADSFRELCTEADANVAELPLAPFDDFLLTQLNQGSHFDPDADNKLLRSLKIHRYGKDSFTTVEESVWLAPESGKEPPKDLKPIWDQLCQNAKIVQRSSKDEVVLRQTHLFKTKILDPNGIIRLACQQSEPHLFGKLIVHYLGYTGNPAKETSGTLKTASWLPLADGSTTTLGNLFWLEGAEEALEMLVPYRAETSTTVTRGEIQLGLAENAGAWNTIRQYLIPKDEDAIQLLRTTFAHNPKLHFGLSNLSSSQALGEWLKAVEGCEADFSPAIALIRALWPTDQGADGAGLRDRALKVAGVFTKEWSGEAATRYDTVLEALRDRHRQAGADIRDTIIKVFHSYLEAAVRAGRWTEAYRAEIDFTLLNQLGEWTSVSQLVIPIAGIARRALADERAVHALGFANDTETEDALSGAVIAQAIGDAELAGLLRDYSATISEQLPVKIWGIFVALLGETPALRTLADDLTGGRTETIRDELCGPVSPGINPRQRVTDNRYSCEITDGDTAEVVALNGDYFDAPLDMDQAAFLVAQSDARHGQWWLNRFFVNPQQDGVHFAFRLCDPASFAGANSAQMLDRLERTVTQLLQEVLHVTNDRLGKVRPLMEKVMGLGQLSLGRAQQEILATAQIHLSQLGIRPQKGSALAMAMNRLDEATSLEAQAREERENEMGDPDGNEKAAKKARDEGLGKLRQALQADAEVHRLLSDAMKTRIGREQYVPESVPFELFQNADDALAQLANDQEAPRVFVMEVHDEALRFAHWGRPINHPDEATGELKRSHERDLVKMLILHGSDKQVGDDDTAVTGKFGLGFKSVYLITDNPQVISGDLSFDVAGAVYPRHLEKDPNSRLRENLEALMPTHKGGTLIELPTKTETEALVQRFASMAPYLVVFAREIREIRLRGNMAHSHHWKPVQVQVGKGWGVWLGDAGSVGGLMQIKCGNVSWLFGLDQHGIRKLDDLPCIWATAPLHSTGELGFAINGPFDPDPGRTELGKGETAEARNRELFLEASEGLCHFLKWCVACDDLCGTLGLSHGALASFWASWWKMFSSLPSPEKDTSAKSRVATSVWPQNGNGGYTGAAKSHAIIPNGLPRNLETLTSIDQVRFQTSGRLESQLGQELLSAVAEWPEWAEMDADLKVSAENVVTRAVAAVLKRQVASFDTESFTLPFLIRRLVGPEGKVTAMLSERLGGFLKSSIWDSEYEWSRQEKEDLEEFLTGLLFQNESGEWVGSKALLIGDGIGNEAGRAALAPPDRRLNQQYSASNGLEFFRLCRGEMRVNAEELAGWIGQALTNQERERIAASLRFLASTNDSCSIESARLLNGGQRKSLLEHQTFGHLSLEDQNRVRNAFQQADMSDARRDGCEYSPQYNTPPIDWPIDPEEEEEVIPLSLQELVDCWNGHEEAAIRQFTVSGIYRALVFPDVAEGADLGALLRDTSSIEGKEHWYRLLCLGCSMSIPLGRNPAARIIPFWRDRLNAEFWEATIPATLEDAKSSGYDHRLDAFFEDIIHQTFLDENSSGEDADFWRRVFYDFRKMHHYVFRDNDLPGVLMQLANSDEVDGSALISFLRSGQIPVSMQMPGNERWAGVIGQSMSAPLLFVMRELRRLNVLPPARFDRACFYMNSPARRVAYRLGWISDEARRDYSLGNLVSLSECIFNRINESEHSEVLLPHFDLPLQWYASQYPR
jgi:hypothetical protein